MIGRILAVVAVFLLLPASAFARGPLDLSFLEKVVPVKGTTFVAPSDVHEDYRMMIYVNVSTSSPSRQKMWVIERDNADDPWRLALWDQRYWKKKGYAASDIPPYSWKVSTGRVYPGEKRAGPTPKGFFNLDDRRYRHYRGWKSSGMVDVMYIDLHYSSGRASGVAMHGTPSSNYYKLGRADSHGCIRMYQPNARSLFDYVHRYDKLAKADNPLWGELPRYYRGSKGKYTRVGYRRDGKLLTDSNGKVLKKTGYRVGLMFFADDPSEIWPTNLAQRPSEKPVGVTDVTAIRLDEIDLASAATQ